MQFVQLCLAADGGVSASGAAFGGATPAQGQTPHVVYDQCIVTNGTVLGVDNRVLAASFRLDGLLPGLVLPICRRIFHMLLSGCVCYGVQRSAQPRLIGVLPKGISGSPLGDLGGNGRSLNLL